MTKRKETRAEKAKTRIEAFSKLTLDEKIKRLEDKGFTNCSEYKRLVIMKESQNKSKE